MAVRIGLFLMIALGAVGLGATIFLGMRPTSPASAQVVAPPPVPMTKILVAARVLRAGNLLVPEDLASKDVPPGQVPANAWIDGVDTRSELRGALIRQQIEKDAVIGKDGVVRPHERGFLAGVLMPGDRAASVAVDAVSGTAGLIWPGDRVDVILTQKLDDNKDLARKVSGETVLQNIRVVAIDKHMTEGESPDTGIAGGGSQRTVTLEVSSKDAERLAVATSLGRLALVIRSASDDAKAPTLPLFNPVVWASDVSAAFHAAGPSGQGQTIHVFAGADASGVEYHY
jgi:pilus assembly protein CpaB